MWVLAAWIGKSSSGDERCDGGAAGPLRDVLKASGDANEVH